ncbi:hypothetical protein MMC20_005728 [Loxospora ochrophaea]|nr:hypothetical protein [Loxospora ochrophaea]
MSWNLRYRNTYGLPEGRAPPHRENIEAHFTLVRVLEEGSGLNQGVYVVRSINDRRLLVQKKIPGDQKYLRREIHILNVLKHPNIVEYVDSFITDRTATTPRESSLYIEYCKLGSLEKLVTQYRERNASHSHLPPARIPESFVWHVFHSLALALQYLHHGIPPDGPPPAPIGEESDTQVAERLGQKWPLIIHRDLKLQNIFLRKPLPVHSTAQKPHSFPLCFLTRAIPTITTPWPPVVLGDFGCATQADDGDFDDVEHFYGTVHWMPPELPEMTARGDIWALGAVILSLCRLLEAGPLPPPPAGTENVETWLESKEARKGIKDVRVGEGYSSDLDNVVWNCLKWKKEHRPFSWKLVQMVTEGRNGALSGGWLEEKQFPSWVFGNG